jgi:hypothetical protein
MREIFHRIFFDILNFVQKYFRNREHMLPGAKRVDRKGGVLALRCI